MKLPILLLASWFLTPLIADSPDEQRDPRALEALANAVAAKGGVTAIQAFDKSFAKRECTVQGTSVVLTQVSWKDDKAGVLNETFFLPGDPPRPFRQFIKLGGAAWEKQFGGLAKAVPPGDLEKIQLPEDVSSVVAIVPILSDKSVRVRLESPMKVGDSDCVVVSAQRPDRVRVVFSFEKKRMLLVRYTVELLGGVDKGQTSEHLLSDHREYAGMIVPRRGTFSINGKAAGSYTLLEYKPLKELPPEIVGRPQ